MPKSNFNHQGKANTGGPRHDHEADLRAMSNQKLDDSIKNLSKDNGQGDEFLVKYLAKLKAERARRVGGGKLKESSMSLLEELIGLLEFDTPGLKLGALRYDSDKHVIYVTIGDKKYVYTPHVADKAGEIYASVTGMAKHSTGRALAFLKKNCSGQKLNESTEKKKIGALKTIEAILDGKLPLAPSTISSSDKKKLMGQRTLLGREDHKSLFYVTIYQNEDTEYDDVEAYVVVDDKTGKLSFHDEDGDHEIYIDSKYVGKGRRSTEEKIQAVVDEFKLESGKAAKGAIAALLTALDDE